MPVCNSNKKADILFTSSGFTSRVVKSFTQSMKQFSVTLLYVPRNSLNYQGDNNFIQEP